MTPEHPTRYWSTLVCAFVGVFLSKGMAAYPGHTGDDYATVLGTISYDHFFSQGRYVTAGTNFLLESIGLTPLHVSFPSFILLSLVTAAVVCLILTYVAPPKVSPMGLGVAALLATTHPYFTEYFLFRQSMIFLFISMSLVAVTLWGLMYFEDLKSRPTLLSYLGFSISLVLACAMLQTSFVIVAIAIFAKIITHMMPASEMTSRDILRTSKAPIILLGLSGSIYIATFIVSNGLAPGLDPRTSFLGVDQIPERLEQVRVLMATILYLDEPIFSTYAKLPLILALVVGMLGIIFIQHILRGPILILLAVLVTCCLSMAFVVISAEWWPAPRSLSAISIATGVLFILTYAHAPKTAQTAMTALGAIAIILFSFHSASMFRDQVRVNNWDHWVAGHLSASLLDQGITPDQEVLLVGASWTHPVTPTTTYYDINISSLFIPTGLNALMTETTGRRWNIRPVAENAGCDNAPIWPAAGAVIIQDEQAPVLICYGM